MHGIAFTAWLLLLLVQTSLVAAGRVDLHRRLGLGGAALAAVMVVLGTIGSLVAAARPTGFFDVPMPPCSDSSSCRSPCSASSPSS